MKERMNHSGTMSSQPSERELVHGCLARKLVAEGMVLLKNEGLLPLNVSMPVALLGSGAAKTVKGGIGSGDVNNRENIPIYQGLKEAGVSLVSEAWLQDYDRRYRAAREEWKEKQKLTITIGQKQFASFSEQMQAWFVEEGSYGLWIGNHSASLKLAAVLTVPGQVIIERTHPVCPVQAEYAELGASQRVQTEADKWHRLAEEQGVQKAVFVPEEEKKGAFRVPPAPEQPAEELIPLLYGNITQGASTLGSAGIRVPGSAGETTEALEETYGIPSLIMSDWNTTVPEDGSIPWQCAAAGNDIIMPGNSEDDKNIREAYMQGLLSENDIRNCAGRIMALAQKLMK